MNKQKGNSLIEALIYLLLWAAAIGGYIANIVKIVDVINDPVTLMLLLRAVGVIVMPLGVIMGYL
jgi:hypothetical protein